MCGCHANLVAALKVGARVASSKGAIGGDLSGVTDVVLSRVLGLSIGRRDPVVI
jgi:hypothetical protein